ncbi:hypothetical protein AAC387_Pa10g0856 [Persea americana]
MSKSCLYKSFAVVKNREHVTSWRLSSTSTRKISTTRSMRKRGLWLQRRFYCEVPLLPLSWNCEGHARDLDTYPGGLHIQSTEYDSICMSYHIMLTRGVPYSELNLDPYMLDPYMLGLHGNFTAFLEPHLHMRNIKWLDMREV